jgi:hypothetical protein
MAVVGRYIFNGTLGSSEVFAYSWGFTHPTWTNAEQAVGAGAVWIARFLSVNGAANILVPSTVHNSVRAVTYNTDGSTSSAYTLPITPIAGGSTSETNSLPYEVSPCVTLRTALSTRRGRGRFYLPPPMRQAVVGNGLWGSIIAASGSGSIVYSVGEAMDNFESTSGGEVVVISKVTGSVITNRVTRVEVGNIPDAQRRRRNRQVETRYSYTMA